MEGAQLIGGFVATITLIVITIVALCMVGWLYSIIAIVFTGGILFLIHLLWKRTKTNKSDLQNNKMATTISNVVIGISVAIIVIGALMFLSCYLKGPTGYAEKLSECGWCGGDGLDGGVICRLCYGSGGVTRTSARYSSTFLNWIGVLLVSSGVVIIFGTRHTKNKYCNTTQKARKGGPTCEENVK